MLPDVCVNNWHPAPLKVVQNNMQCPTLLTRQGERIRSNGKFGGLQNKAPPIEKLRGQVFGAPLSKEHIAINKQIELLQQYSAAVEKAAEVKGEYDGHIQYLQSPQMKQKEEELQQHKDELQDIEEKLASTPRRTPNASVSSLKRNLAEETDESFPTKRVRRKTQKLDS